MGIGKSAGKKSLISITNKNFGTGKNRVNAAPSTDSNKKRLGTIGFGKKTSTISDMTDIMPKPRR